MPKTTQTKKSTAKRAASAKRTAKPKQQRESSAYPPTELEGVVEFQGGKLTIALDKQKHQEAVKRCLDRSGKVTYHLKEVLVTHLAGDLLKSIIIID